MWQKTDRARSCNPRGFTLVGLLVAMVASTIIIGVLTLLLQSTSRNYVAQKQLELTARTSADVARHVGDILLEAGGGIPLPVTGIVRTSANGETLSVKYNPTGAFYQAPADDVGDDIVTVDDARPFVGLSDLKYYDNNDSVHDISVDISENTGNFSDGIDTVRVTCGYMDVGCGEMDSIKLTSNINLHRNEAIYRQSLYRFYVNNSTNELMQEIDGTAQVLAEHVETLSAAFYDWGGTPRTDWEQMARCSLLVVARGDHEKGYSGTADGARRDTTRKMVFFRNTRLD